jgi:hypothetical protein
VSVQVPPPWAEVAPLSFVPEQSALAGLAQVQAPATQLEPVSQTMPQAPQFALSVLVSTQTLLPPITQTVEVAPAHCAEQTPFAQYGKPRLLPVPQTLPQAPQFWGLNSELVQA